MHANIPVVIEGATKGWRACKEWVRPDGSVNLGFLEQRFGSARVAVTDTGAHHQGAGPCREMALADYIAWWRQHAAGQPAAAQQVQGQAQDAAAAAATGRCPEAAVLYVKDWHLHSEFPDYQAYCCPEFFQDDWLNEFYDHKQRQRRQRGQQSSGNSQHQHQLQHEGREAVGRPQQEQKQETEDERGVQTADYRFVYLGPAGSSTPLHADVLRSFSWSANITGRKLWRLLPPCHTHLLRDRHRRSLAHDFYADTASPQAAQQFPGLAQARQHLIELVQQPGEALFVPSGWHHTVSNLSPGGVLSINHNWLNGHNVHWCWGLLQREYEEAAEAIADCRDLCRLAEFEGLVQRNLGANAGMDFSQFAELLRWVAGSACLGLERCDTPDSAWRDAEALQLVFRLQRAGWVLQQLLALEQRVQARASSSEHACAQTDLLQGDDEALPYAAEIEANMACLERILDTLDRVGLAHVLAPSPSDTAALN